MGFVFLRLAYFTKYDCFQLHPFCCEIQSFVFCYDWVVFRCVFIPYFLYPHTSWWTSGFIPHLSYYDLNWDKPGGTDDSHVPTLFCLGKVPGVEWLDHIACLFTDVWETAIQSSIPAILLDFFTSSGLGYFLFQSFPAFDVFWFLHDSQSIQGELKPHCDFYFYVWWLVNLSLFSHVCWFFLFSSLKNASSSPRLISYLDCLLYCCWVSWALCSLIY